ncbi:hypothetical protein FE257_010255 [Aspergillus nanangensis]|uniref:Carrier domain-containing protein n=1 Tax=Aspergillus nanangensis TaxID=2582783 RepID=A0AAD4CIZ9_ASPNN|nr:hypothetical protein FE257_010255 [Aspergillus nanangensis]
MASSHYKAAAENCNTDCNHSKKTQVADRYPLADVVYTLASRRSKLQHRSFRIVNNNDVRQGLAVEKPIVTSPPKPTKIGFIFTGQGAQWHGMGARLLEYGIFRTTITFLDEVIRTLGKQDSWSIVGVLSAQCNQDHIQSPEVSQTACTALQIGLVDLLASWSVRPSAVVGHSSGEIAAAYASGHMTAAEAIAAAYYRGQAVSKNKQPGAMLAVGLGATDVSEYLNGKEENVRLAAINSPASSTLSGDADAIERLSTTLSQRGIFNRVLQTGGTAYHSQHMRPLAHEYSIKLSAGLDIVRQHGLADTSLRYPHVPWISSVTPDRGVPNPIPPSYWRRNLESAVMFSPAVSNMITLDSVSVGALVEIGPHSALKGPVNQILNIQGSSVGYIDSLKRGQDDQESMLQLAGSLFETNASVDLVAVNAVEENLHLTHGCAAVDLPPYQYNYGPVIYHESRMSTDYRLRRSIRHDLLGSKIPGTSQLHPQWRNVLRVKDLPWLGDYRLLPDVIFPAAGFLCTAVEAATQVYNDTCPAPLGITGYLLRTVSISSALRIPEDDNGVEIIVNISPVEVTTAKSPSWTSFSISSVTRDLGEWTQHCCGLVKVDVSTLSRDKNLSSPVKDPRRLDVRSWYQQFAAAGIGYGRTFQALSNIQANPDENVAQAHVALNTTENTIPGGESRYPLHPAALDAAFQLGLIACYGGQVERATTAFVPVQLSQLYIKNNIDGDSSTATARETLQGLRGAHINLQMLSDSGGVIVDAENIRCISYSEVNPKNRGQPKEFSSPFMRMVWKPDIRTVTNTQLRQIFPSPENHEEIAALEQVDMIACLVVADIYDRFVRVELPTKPDGDLRHWLNWVKSCVEQDKRQNMVRASDMSSDNRHDLLETLYNKAGDIPEATAARRLHDNAGLILQGEKTGLDVLVPDGLLTRLYETGLSVTGIYSQLFNFLDCMGHANPHLRVLEVGAGTGGATRVAMKVLVGANGIKRYADYTFTDISAGFLTSAQGFMSDFHDVRFSILDIEHDPREQGYDPVYDIVLASQSIHATSSMENTLANCRKLLKPGGKLVLLECTQVRVMFSLISGTLTGYWLGVSDDLSTLAPQKKEQHRTGSRVVHLLHGHRGPPPLLLRLVQEFACREIATKTVPFAEVLEVVSANSYVVAFLEGENLLLDANGDDLKRFQYLSQNAISMICLTSCGIVKGRDPDAAVVMGLLRVIGSENPAARFSSIDIDANDFNIKDEDLVRSIVDCENDLQDLVADDASEDREFVWQDGCMWVSRAVPDIRLESYTTALHTPKNTSTKLTPLLSQGPVRATFETPGILSSLYFRPYTELWQPLPPHYMEVKVSAVGLNWKDMDLASGHLEEDKLSSDYAGVVTKAGSGVASFSVGDRVYGMGRGHFGTHTRVPAAFAQKLLPTDHLTEVATMPVVYMTGLYAFDHVAHLRKGQTVLIESATSGLGLAAIQLARTKGAEVFATAGTEEKIQFLTESMGFAPSHVFNSRDYSGLSSEAARRTDKGGFDVILSTGVGDRLYESLESIAPQGHLIDVGQLDVLESKPIGIELLPKNASFSSFDLQRVLDLDPRLGGHLMKTMHELYRSGQISPIRFSSVTDVSNLDQTLHAFSKATHIGKMVVTFENPASVVKMIHGPPAATFDPKARYIITGGFGGLGRSIIRWMVNRNARDIVVLSRRGIGAAHAQSLVDGLTDCGIHITAMACDIGDQKQVTNAIEHAASDRPIRGVIHAALSLSDLLFDKLSLDQWRAGTIAKTQGTKSLHEATKTLPLDFFILATSTGLIWAPPTQSAYIAASNFQDCFARYRRSLGMPASAIAFGLVSDVESDWSHVSSGTAEMFSRLKALDTTEYQFLTQLEPAFLNLAGHEGARYIGQEHDSLSTANVLTCLDPAAMADRHRDGASGSSMISTTVPRWYRDGRVSLIIRALDDARRYMCDSDAARDGDGLDTKSSVSRFRHDFDEAMKAGPQARAKTVDLVTDCIITCVAEMLFIEVSSVDRSKCVADHGVDSLVAAEVRNWLYQALGINLRMPDLMDLHTSIEALATDIVDGALQAAGG